MAQGYAGITVIVLWLLLAILAFIAATGGEMPSIAKGLALVLVPASGAAAFVAIDLAASSAGTGPQWPLVIPTAGPLVIMAYAVWATVPAIRSAIPPNVAGAIAGGTLLVLSIAPWPLVKARGKEESERSARNAAAYEVERTRDEGEARQEALARYEKLTPASPLWLWMEFLEGDSALRSSAIGRIGAVPSRQADAEQMLGRGVRDLMYHLPYLSLTATPALCEGARGIARAASARFVPPREGELGYTLEWHRVDLYLPSLEWLVENGCQLDAEIAAIEAGVRAYPDSPQRTSYLASLASLRRPH